MNKIKFPANEQKMEYPAVSIIVVLVLIYASPFVSLYLNYLAFLICIYRIVRYEESVFAVDYCVLASVSFIFVSTGIVSLFSWLSIVAALLWIIKTGVKPISSFALLVILLNYMLFRMQGEANTFVLCVSQMIMMFVLLSNQRQEGIVYCIKGFCLSVIVSSIYALVFRNASQINRLLGNEVEAYWKSSFTRFRGLFRDPNYYMTMIAVAIALLAVLYLNRYLSQKAFALGAGILTVFGALTYSKTFLIVLAVFAMQFVAMLFSRKRYILGILSVFIFVIVGVILSRTVLAVTIYRFTSTDNLYELTTGRSELIAEYLHEITKSAGTLFFGKGLSAEILGRGTHNLYLEIVYYYGLVGLGIMIAYIVSLIRLTIRRFEDSIGKRNGILKYAVLLIFLLLFSTLQGLRFSITYVILYLSILATIIVPKKDIDFSVRSDEDETVCHETFT